MAIKKIKASELIPQTATLRNNMAIRVIVKGPITGNSYDFPPSGQLEVAVEDVPGLLLLKSAVRACCGADDQDIVYFTRII